MKLEITDCPLNIDDDFVAEKTREYNLQFIEKDVKPLSVYFRDSEDNIVAGLTGKTYWNWLHIDFLWVSESERKKQLGSKLIAAAEDEAIKVSVRASPSRQAQILIYYFFPFLSGVKRQVGLRL